MSSGGLPPGPRPLESERNDRGRRCLRVDRLNGRRSGIGLRRRRRARIGHLDRRRGKDCRTGRGLELLGLRGNRQRRGDRHGKEGLEAQFDLGHDGGRYPCLAAQANFHDEGRIIRRSRTWLKATCDHAGSHRHLSAEVPLLVCPAMLCPVLGTAGQASSGAQPDANSSFLYVRLSISYRGRGGQMQLGSDGEDCEIWLAKSGHLQRAPAAGWVALASRQCPARTLARRQCRPHGSDASSASISPVVTSTPGFTSIGRRPPTKAAVQNVPGGPAAIAPGGTTCRFFTRMNADAVGVAVTNVLAWSLVLGLGSSSVFGKGLFGQSAFSGQLSASLVRKCSLAEAMAYGEQQASAVTFWLTAES